MTNLPEHVGRSITERKLFDNGGRVLVAVSGGLDSMVLLHVLHELAPRFGWKLFVAHFNHQLRGRASDADARFVRKAAAALGLPFQAGRGSVRALVRKRGLSIEMAARELRHKFLARAAWRANCRAIAVAHHADDQVELFFLRVLRGAGGDGLAGMKWQSVSPADGRLKIVRPLLNVTKEALRQIAQEWRIRHREDASNSCGDMLRNRLRHELLPRLRRRFQPALDRMVLRMMEIVGADADVATEAARAWLNLTPALRQIASQPVGLQRRVIQLQLRQRNLEAGFDLVEALRCPPGHPVTVAPGLRLRCDEAGQILQVTTTRGSFRRQRQVVRLTKKSDNAEFAGVKISWRQVSRRGKRRSKPAAGREIFDADRVGSRIVLRHWQPGDRFQPIGMSAAVKLQDWFTNQKIARERRQKLIVAMTASGIIFWIEGQRIGEEFKLRPDTRRRLDWRWERP